MQLIQHKDYNVNPFIVIWEVTRACALKCLHCRAEAQYHPDPRQLTFEEGKKLIDEIAEMDDPLFVFTGETRSCDRICLTWRGMRSMRRDCPFP